MSTNVNQTFLNAKNVYKHLSKNKLVHVDGENVQTIFYHLSVYNSRTSEYNLHSSALLNPQVNVEPVVYVLSPPAYTITQEVDEKRGRDKMSTTKKC